MAPCYKHDVKKLTKNVIRKEETEPLLIEIFEAVERGSRKF